MFAVQNAQTPDIKQKGDFMDQRRLFGVLLLASVAACSSVGGPGTEETAAPVFNAEPSYAPDASGSAPTRSAQLTPMRSSGGTSTKTGAPAMTSVYFDYDKDDIKPEFRRLLEEHAKYLRENPGMRVRIEGFADERGSREYNLALGQRRAEAVMANLKLLGVSESNLEAISYGEERPRRTGHDEASWAENRRGDVLMHGR
jgi:peptidoglycan-associated lipoprotein